MVSRCVQEVKVAASDTASSGSLPRSLKAWQEGRAAKTGRGASDTLGDPCCASFRCCAALTPDCCHSSLRKFSSFNLFVMQDKLIFLGPVNLILTEIAAFSVGGQERILNPHAASCTCAACCDDLSEVSRQCCS